MTSEAFSSPKGNWVNVTFIDPDTGKAGTVLLSQERFDELAVPSERFNAESLVPILKERAVLSNVDFNERGRVQSIK
jgi:hypothetical protein